MTLVSTPDDDNGAAVPLFVTLKGEFVVEKNFVGKVSSEHAKPGGPQAQARLTSCKNKEIYIIY